MTATQDIRTATYDNILVERDAPIATITRSAHPGVEPWAHGASSRLTST